MTKQRGPGRPAIGGAVHVKLGKLKPLVEQWAAQHSVSHAEAVRRLVELGLESGADAAATTVPARGRRRRPVPGR